MADLEAEMARFEAELNADAEKGYLAAGPPGPPPQYQFPGNNLYGEVTIRPISASHARLRASAGCIQRCLSCPCHSCFGNSEGSTLSFVPLSFAFPS
jgi:hypothetical protein